MVRNMPVSNRRSLSVLRSSTMTFSRVRRAKGSRVNPIATDPASQTRAPQWWASQRHRAAPINANQTTSGRKETMRCAGLLDWGGVVKSTSSLD